MNTSKASCMTCAMHGMWFHNAGHLIPEASSVNTSLRGIEYFDEALSVLIPSKVLAVSLKGSSTSFKFTVSLAPVCRPLTNHPELAFENTKE